MSYECNQPITINLNYFTTTTKIASGVNLILAYILNNYINTLICVRIPVFASILINTVI